MKAPLNAEPLLDAPGMTESLLGSGQWMAFSAGLVGCLVFSAVCMRWIAPLGWLDHPRGRRTHHRPTPRTGGIALLLAILVGQVSGLLRIQISAKEWGVVYAMGLMGILDDRFDIRARWKALLSLVGALVLAWMTWPVLKGAGTYLPLLGGELATKTGLALLLLWAWYWAAPHACNLIDGMNGLAVGFFLLLTISMGSSLGLLAHWAYLLGALAGLALLNWPSGMQFLGDSGALTMGTLFAILCVHKFSIEGLDLLLWAFAYPVADVLMVMAIRASNGQSLGEGDRNHYHHQWQRVTGGHQNWSLVLTLLPSLATMQMLQDYPGHELIARAGVIWLLVAAGYFYFQSVPFRPRTRLARRLERKATALRPRQDYQQVASGEVLAFVPRSARPEAVGEEEA